MADRPCKQCVWHTEDGCSSWNCEPLTRKEVLELQKKVKELENKVKVFEKRRKLLKWQHS